MKKVQNENIEDEKMIIENIRNRGVFFTFEDGDSAFNTDTSIYLINTENKIFLCDTHLGPKSMEVIKEYITNNKLNYKEIIAFNSHADWDHVWGNCSFEGATIVGHKLCRKTIQQEGAFYLERKKKYHNGYIELELPNLTFDSKLEFPNDQIEFIYAPGHTIDSSICFDKKDSVVFAGDLLEHPIPYTYYYDLKTYLQTLEFIKNLNAKIILSSHSGRIHEKLFADNIEYIKNLLLKNPVDIKDDEYLSQHNYNLKKVLISEYEYIVRERLKDKFNFESFRRELWNSIDNKYDNLSSEYSYIHDINYEDLKEALTSFISKLA